MKRFSQDTIAALMSEGTLRLAPQGTALVVVDMQICLLDRRGAFGRIWGALLPEDSALYFARVESLVLPNIERLLERFRAFALPVVFTALGSAREDGGDLARWARRHNAMSRQLVGMAIYPPQTDPSWRIHGDLGPAAGEAVLAKTTSGAVASTPLAEALRGLGVDTVVVAGVATDVSVTQTARELADRGFQAVIVADACTALAESRHQAALETFTFAYGSVSTTRAILGALPRPAAGAA